MGSRYDFPDQWKLNWRTNGNLRIWLSKLGAVQNAAAFRLAAERGDGERNTKEWGRIETEVSGTIPSTRNDITHLALFWLSKLSSKKITATVQKMNLQSLHNQNLELFNRNMGFFYFRENCENLFNPLPVEYIWETRTKNK